MSPSDFRHLYLAGFGLLVLGGVILLTVELIAWADKQDENTISEIMWNLNIPGFLYFTAAGALVSFIVGLTIHFVARGKLGL